MDSFQKRNRERKKLEKRKAKLARRLDRGEAKNGGAEPGESTEVDLGVPPTTASHEPAPDHSTGGQQS